MYVPEKYQDYCYLVSYSDNYVVLSKRDSVDASFQNPITIPVIIQYYTPSITTLELNRQFNSSQQFTEIDIDSSFYSRADCSQLITCILFLIFFLLFILNGLYKYVVRGGLFFGK